ncbi:MAG: 23S rRNA (uracil(1939)-C(5))-methyltransferase RlmD [Eubacterium sp.]|nr:23S rRNA (uracil(1939)-C(5))-methyltransferase RlmD [Eubacterium sp.]
MHEYKKNDRLELDIKDISQDGLGIGKADGYAVFVKDTVPGDKVLAGLTKVKKNYAFGRLINVLAPSPDRIEPRCPVALSCGGCQIQMMDYSAQLSMKEDKVKNDMARIGGFENPPMEPIAFMKDPWRYRNKAQVPVGRDKQGNLCAGFYAGRTHSVIPFSDCLLAPAEFQTIIDAILDWMRENHLQPYEEETGRGLVRHILIRKGFATGEILVCLIANLAAGKELPAAGKLADKLKNLSLNPCLGETGIVGITLSRNTRKTNVILGSKPEVIWGRSYLEDLIGPIRYRISSVSFYQVNPAQTVKLYERALECAALTGRETVLDLYCGIGTISLFLAQKAKKVIGVEIVEQAVEDARENARLNDIDNAEFYAGKAEEVVPELFEKGLKHADVVVVDPPRKGLDQTLIDTVLKINPDRIVYVSCDPATLARDTKLLCQGGYDLKSVKPYDQFAHSVHVETVCLLTHS